MSQPVAALRLLGGLSLRPSVPADENLLLELFMAARPWFNWTDLEPDAIRFLYEEQWRINRIGVGTVYPEHLDFVVEKTGQAVAHLLIDLGYHDWRITQFAVHPKARNKGIGSDVVRSLQAAAATPLLPLTVSTAAVLTGAVRFWTRHGFRIVSDAPPVLHMAWLPAGRPVESTWFS
jgi:GNAT superfamily N-acetyltransferase